VVGAGAVWVQTQGATVRVDPRSNRVVGAAPAEFTAQIQAAGPDGLWSWRCATEFDPAKAKCRLLRLDLRTLAVTARILLPAVPAAMVVGAGSAWVLDASGPWAWRVEVASGRTARVRLPGAQPLASEFGGGWIALGAGAVWVASDWVETPTALGSRVGLVRIDPAAMRVAAVVPLGNLDGTAGLAVGTGGVWVQGRQPQRPSAPRGCWRPGSGRSGWRSRRPGTCCGSTRSACDPLALSYVSSKCLIALLSREDGVLSYRPLCLHDSWVERSTSGFAGCRSVGRREAYRLRRANE
jgi:hypothetical protein